MPNKRPTQSEVTPAGEVSQHEKDQRIEAAIRASAARVLEAERLRNAEDVIEILNELEAPNRSKAPKFENDEHYAEPKRHRGVISTNSPSDRIYARMSPEEREWRSPDSDFWMAEWIRGNFAKDKVQMLQASAKLDEMFGRAQGDTISEGAAGASGAIGAGTGASLIPRPLEQVVLIARDRVAKMRRFARIMNMTRQTHTIPTANAMIAYMTSEGFTADSGEPVISNVQIEARKGQALGVASKEMLADSATNLVSMLATRAGGALGELEDNQAFRLGNGSAPNIQRMTGTAFVSASTNVLAYSDVLSMYFTIPQIYRDAGIWLIASDVLQMLSNVRDGQGRPFYQGLTDVPGAIVDDSGQIGSILRRPVYESPWSDGQVWFGDPQAQYTFGSRQGIEMDASEHVNFTSDQIMWKWTQRFGGQNVDTIASQYNVGPITSATSL